MKKSRSLLAGLVAVALSVVLLASACEEDKKTDGDATATAPAATEPAGEATPTEADGGEASAVDVQLADFSIAPSPDTIPAGDVTFTATNNAVISHTLEVIRTDLPADALPTTDEDIVDEEAEGLELVVESDDIRAGESAEISATLEPGSYVLICNIETHYDAGMQTAFTVQ